MTDSRSVDVSVVREGVQHRTGASNVIRSGLYEWMLVVYPNPIRGTRGEGGGVRTWYLSSMMYLSKARE